MSDLTQQIRSQGTLIFGTAGNADPGAANGVDVDAKFCVNATPIPGILQVCATAIHYSPCQDDGVICVTGMQFNNTIKDNGSNWATETRVIAGPFWTEVSTVPITLADGVAQTVANPDGSFNNTFNVGFNGTSAATPFVAGSAALLVAADPTQTADREEHCLFQPIHPPTDGMFNTLVPDVLASVKCVIGGSPFADLPTFLRIDSPTDGATVDLGQVNVSGTATDYEEGLLSISWTSDVDGPLTTSGSGATGSAQFHTPGIQHLTASTIGSDGIRVSKTITVTVGDSGPPFTIDRPSVDGLSFAQGLEVTFDATLASIDQLICSAVRWSSTSSSGQLDFQNVAGCTIQPTILGPGSHTIVAAYVDPDTGVRSVASREIEIAAVSGFVVQIVSPAKTGNQQLAFDQDLTFAAQQINGTNVSYAWSITTSAGTVAIPGASQTVTVDPNALLTETCDTVTVQIDVTAINGADGTLSHDSEQILLGPSEGFINDNCTR